MQFGGGKAGVCSGGSEAEAGRYVGDGSIAAKRKGF